MVATTSIKIWHVKEYSYQPLPEGDYGHFHSSEGEHTDTAVTSILSQRSLHKMMKFDAVLMARIHAC